MSQIMEIYLPILSAGTIWFADKNTLKKNSSLLNTLITVKPTIFIGISTVWDNIDVPFSNIIKTITPSNILLKKIGLNKCKLCININTILTYEIKEKFKNMGIKCNKDIFFIKIDGPNIFLPNAKPNIFNIILLGDC